MEQKLSKNISLLLIILGLVSCQSQESDSKQITLSDQLASSQIIDLTHTFDSTSVYWPTAEGFVLNVDFAGQTDKGYYYEANTFKSAEHCGTHLDAPIHFAEGKQSVDEISLSQLMGAAVVIDVSEKSLSNPDYQVNIEDIEAWEKLHGTIADGSILLIYTGYSQFWPDRKRYMGTEERGIEAVAKLHFPGIHADLARWLIANRSIQAVGIDTPSIDYGQSEFFESHRIFYEQNIPGFENLTNLDMLPPKGSTVIALPMKIGGGSGAPLRAIALLEGSGINK